MSARTDDPDNESPVSQGDWQAVKRRQNGTRGRVLITRVETRIGSSTYVLTDRVYTTVHDPDETWGNACLMAAGKELYAACQELAHWVDGKIDDDQTWLDRQAPALKSAWIAAKRAIEKADNR